MGTFLIFLAILSATTGYVPISAISDTITNVNLKQGQIYDFVINKPLPQGITYLFNTSPGNIIRVYCDDFRLPSAGGDPMADCIHGEVIFREGNSVEKKCGRVPQPVLYKSKGSQLEISISNFRAGSIECMAKSSEITPVKVSLKQYDEAYAIDSRKEGKPYLEKAWSFNSPTGTRISIQCGVSFNKYHERCYQNILTIDNGNGEVEYCEEKDLVLFSQGNTMNVRLQLDKVAGRHTRCILQAVSGPHANEHENMEQENFEEDSSEYGVAPGRVSTSCKCGWANKESQRIFHGQTAKEGEYPWMVAIRYADRSQRCGGSIITPWHVLTAAHCMYDSKVRDVNKIYETIVSVGTNDRLNDASHGETQYIKVKQTFIPTEYTKFQKNYDIAVLYLENKIRYSQWVGPVCMPPIAFNLIYKNIRITGWGLDHTGNTPQFLMTTKLRVLPRNICDVPDWIICQSSRTTSTCFGDSGSPFVYLDPETNRYTQVSVVSYGNADCLMNSGSSNVSYHMDFIKDAIQRTKPQQLCM